MVHSPEGIAVMASAGFELNRLVHPAHDEARDSFALIVVTGAAHVSGDQHGYPKHDPGLHIAHEQLESHLAGVASFRSTSSGQLYWRHLSSKARGTSRRQDLPSRSSHNPSQNFLNSTSDGCRVDRTQPPVLNELIGCKNSSLFSTWRPKARVIGPRGWMNDPWQYLKHTTGLIMLDISATRIAGMGECLTMLSFYYGFRAFQGSPQLERSPNDYTYSVTMDAPGPNKWPEQHLSGFRDPFVFKSSEFSRFYANESIVHQTPGNPNAVRPSGNYYLLLSGGIRTEVDPVHGGPRLFLYRQTEENNIRDWTYLGPLTSSVAERNQTSEWTGAKGINYECGSITKIDEHGLVKPQVLITSKTELNVIVTGTEGGRVGPGYWPIWHAVSWDFTAQDGNVKSKIDFSGVIDWGKAYASICLNRRIASSSSVGHMKTTRTTS
ncbi:hypothetical protein KEM48_013836 [Puccinia striiformis f. sp. tritici PST-130]|nr:hypothetical protein KEM48_013836 [Puccinia striiformis f. sp. tritici PST-130]